MLNIKTSLLFLTASLFAQTPPIPPAVPVQVPLNLTREENLELENFRLKLKILQSDISNNYKDLQTQVNDYQKNTLANHPGAKYQLNLATLNWEQIPESPKPVEKPKSPEVAKPTTKEKK